MFFAELRQREYTKVPRWSQLIVCTRVLGGLAFFIRVWVDFGVLPTSGYKVPGRGGCAAQANSLVRHVFGGGWGPFDPASPMEFPPLSGEPAARTHCVGQ